ncbi:MAG: peptide transporter, partial [Planctomycetes bacterium RBG_13_60_9]
RPEYLTAPLPTKKMPPGIPYILTNEATERFAFYGMRCILVFFMTNYLVNSAGQLAPMTDEKGKFWFHLFVSSAYFTPLIGALISDIWLGKFRTIILFSVIYCLGLFALTVDHTRVGLGLGLGLVALGSGVIKPCVSANVGDQFGQSNKHLMSRIYNWFYWCINLGAVISNLLIPELLDRYGPTVAFAVPAGMMVLATIAFWLGRWRFVHIPRAGFGFVKECFSGEGLRTLGRLSIIYIFLVPFWAIYDQMDSAWVLLAEKLDRNWLWHEWKPSQVVAANPLLILVLIPLFSYVIYPVLNRLFKLTDLRKIGIGLFLVAVPFVMSAFIEQRVAAGAKPSIAWMFLAYVVLTSAEILVSITGLEFSYTQAPKEMKSFIMAIFFLPIGLGNSFTAVVNYIIANPDGTSKLSGSGYYWFFAIVMLAVAALYVPVAARYKRKDYIQDEAPAQSQQ